MTIMIIIIIIVRSLFAYFVTNSLFLFLFVWKMFPDRYKLRIALASILNQ